MFVKKKPAPESDWEAPERFTANNRQPQHVDLFRPIFYATVFVWMNMSSSTRNKRKKITVVEFYYNKTKQNKNIDMLTSYLITSTMTHTKCTLYTHNECSTKPALAVTNTKYCSLHPLQINLICKYSPILWMKSEDDRLLSIMLK